MALTQVTVKLLYWKPKCDIIPLCANIGRALVVVNLLSHNLSCNVFVSPVPVNVESRFVKIPNDSCY